MPTSAPIDAPAPPAWQAAVADVVAASNDALLRAKDGSASPPVEADPDAASGPSRPRRRSAFADLIGFATGLQVRRDSEALLRGIYRKAAVDGGDGSTPASRSLESLIASTPQPPRLLAALAGIATLLITENLTGAVAELTLRLNTSWIFVGEASPTLTNTLKDLGRTIDVRSANDLVNGFAQADLPQLINLTAAFTISVFIVGRLFTYAHARANAILGRPWALPRDAADEDRAQTVDARQEALFAALRVPRPREVPFDLAVKALVCVPALLLWIFLLRRTIQFTSGQSAAVYAALRPLVGVGLLTGTRLFWIARQWRLRRSGFGAFLLVMAACAAVGVVSPLQAAYDPLRPLPLSDPLRLTLSAQTDLEGIDLRSRDLQGFYLVHKDMRGAQLEYTQLQEADLVRSNLVGAVMKSTELDGANLAEAAIQGADLTFVQGVRVNLTHASLAGASLSRASLLEARLTGADLSHCELAFANLASVSAERADFTGANMPNVDLEYGHLQGAVLRGSRLVDALLLEANLDGADLSHADLAGSALNGARFENADLRDATFKEANAPAPLDVKGADLRGATLGEVPFVGDSRTRWPKGYLPRRVGQAVYPELASHAVAPRSKATAAASPRAHRHTGAPGHS